MEDVGFWEGILRDLSGAGRFRLILQPTLAVVLGVRIGLADARAHKRPFVSRLIRSSHQRWQLIRGSLVHAAVPLTLALVMDGFFQHLTLGRIRLLPAVVVGLLLVWLPFTIARGLANRVWTKKGGRGIRRAEGS